ncbi:MAG TPA: hypothetical protein VIP46_03030 [Pyrinomonadaceae bacterium]
MHPRDLAARHEAKVFDSTEAAEKEGFTLGQSAAVRNAWNRDSAAASILYDLVGRKRRGEVAEIGLVLDGPTVVGCYLPKSESAEAGR